MGITLLNRGKRVIKGKVWTLDSDNNRVPKLDKNGREIHYDFMPETAIEFDETTAAYLKRLFGSELMSPDDVKQSFAGATQAEDNAPKVATPSMNIVPEAPAEKAVMQSDLSPEELAAVRAMRMSGAEEIKTEEPVIATAPADEKKKGGLLAAIRGN